VLYFQVFAVTKKMRYVIWAGIAFSVCIYLPHPILVCIFQIPRNGAPWASMATSDMPAKLSFFAPIHGIGSIVLDIYILIIPMVVLGRLHMSHKRKMGLIGVFTTALLYVVPHPP